MDFPCRSLETIRAVYQLAQAPQLCAFALGTATCSASGSQEGAETSVKLRPRVMFGLRAQQLASSCNYDMQLPLRNILPYAVVRPPASQWPHEEILCMAFLQVQRQSFGRTGQVSSLSTSALVIQPLTRGARARGASKFADSRGGHGLAKAMLSTVFAANAISHAHSWVPTRAEVVLCRTATEHPLENRKLSNKVLRLTREGSGYPTDTSG